MKAAAPGLPRRVHCVGIAGGGVAALARLLVERGHEVTGSDRAEAPADLAGLGVRVFRGHHAGHLGGAQAVVYSLAVPGDNPELGGARARGLPVLRYSEAVGRLLAERRGLAVAGTHGKTTTTALIAHLLDASGAAPSWIVGGRPRDRAAARWDTGPLMVVEACEYRLSFLDLACEVAVVTGVGADHLDCFGDAAGVHGAFARFVAGLPRGGTLVAGTGPVPDYLLPRGVVRRDVADDVRLVALDERPQGFEGRLAVAGREHAFRLACLGAHNVDLMRTAVAACRAAGLDPAGVVPHVASFRGVARRLEDHGEVPRRGGGRFRLVDDFAHHPEAVEAAARAVRSRFPGRRVVGVFQPHQVSRTEDFLDAFARALAGFDAVALCDIFVARDAHPERAAALGDALGARLGARATPAGPARSAAPVVSARLRPDDVCVVMGAGDVDRLAAGLGAPPRP